ncbi:hypothetical protein NIES2101_34750 [Calothrix sp. HK-06]|nr:hypothetical protein NIES2101_34750 [Calothrix sp. HK-06]
MGEILEIASFQSFDVPLNESPQEGIADVARSSSELAAYFRVDKKTIQTWFKVIIEAYCWLPESDFKFGSGKYVRYTRFCIQQMEVLKTEIATGKSFQQWVSEVHINNNQHPTTKSQSSSLVLATSDKDAVLATEKLQASSVVLEDARQTLQDAYQQQPTLAKNLAKLFGARFKEQFASAYAVEVKQAVSEVLNTTDFER